jgi:outer membrane receptor for ferrienterochelin and colicin
VLETLLQNTNLSFKVIAGKVALFEKEVITHGNKRATIHGYISDAESGERLINANVFNPDNYVGTISNNFGFYSYSTLSRQLKLAVTYMGYKSQTIDLELKNDTTINIALYTKSDELGEITILSSQTNQVENTQMSMIDMPIQKLKKVPVILGEADVLKVIQLLPGVQAGVEGTSGIYVRGGGSDQNLFLLDGVPVYNPSHLLGIFSAFNPEALKTVKLYKGGFPARFGGRLSSVVDISMKDGNMKKLKGDFSIGLISSKFTLEGPLKKDKTSFMLSARRSYADAIASPVLAIVNKMNNDNDRMGAFFHDFNLKLNHVFSERSRLYWSTYYGLDKGYVSSEYDNSNNIRTLATETYEEKNDLSWGNTISSLRWNYLINPKLFSNSTLTYSRYNFEIETSFKSNDLEAKTSDENLFSYSSGIKDISGKIDFDYCPSPQHAIKFGTSYTFHQYAPNVTQYKIEDTSFGETKADTTMGMSGVNANEWSVFIEDNFSLSSNLSINGGIHISMFNVQGRTFIRPQPRFAIRYKARENWSLKASYSRMVQHIHLLSTSGINLPTDLWVPITKEFEPPVSDQWALGTNFRLKNGVDLSIESFYKSMNNLLEYKEGASFMNNAESWTDKVEAGKGWSYGVEFLLEKSIGKTTGWIGYTWSKSERLFETINYGNIFPAKYDRRHDISIVCTHKFSERFDIGGTWVYSTGNAVTLALMKYSIADIPLVDYFNIHDELKDYQARNNYRMPAYHRMDFGMNFHKTKKHGIRTWSLSIYNVYNHLNPFMLFWKEDKNNKELDQYENYRTPKELMKLSIFPFIPSVSYSYKF